MAGMGAGALGPGGPFGAAGLGGALGAAGLGGGQFGMTGANLNLGDMQQQHNMLQQQLQAHQQQLQQQMGQHEETPKRRSSSLSSNGSLTPFSRRRSSMGGVFGAGGNANTNSDFQKLFTGMPADGEEGKGKKGKGKGKKGKSKSSGPAATSNTAKLNQMKKEKKKRAKTFPEKLMHALIDHSDEEAVAWLPDGKSFVIVNPDLFCEDVLSNVFKISKYASFVRKLHRWGFVRLTSGTGKLQCSGLDCKQGSFCVVSLILTQCDAFFFQGLIASITLCFRKGRKTWLLKSYVLPGLIFLEDTECQAWALLVVRIKRG